MSLPRALKIENFVYLRTFRVCKMREREKKGNTKKKWTHDLVKGKEKMVWNCVSKYKKIM